MYALCIVDGHVPSSSFFLGFFLRQEYEYCLISFFQLSFQLPPLYSPNRLQSCLNSTISVNFWRQEESKEQTFSRSSKICFPLN